MAFCSNCGSQIVANATFCGECGTAAIQTPSTTNAPQATTLDMQMAEMLFVGKNHEYYKHKWNKGGQTQAKQSGGFLSLYTLPINFAAFFFAPFWLAYRKMYLYSFLLIAAEIALLIVGDIFNFPDRIFRSFAIGTAAGFGIGGNFLYKSFVKKRVQKIIEESSPEKLKEALSQQGGVSISAAIIAFVLYASAIFAYAAFVEYVNPANARQQESSSSVSGQSSSTQSKETTSLPAIPKENTAQASKQPPSEVPTQAQAADAAPPASIPVKSENFTPSFDCAKASTGQERLICSDKELSALDVELMQAYKKLLNNLPVSDRDRQKNEQRNWIKYTRDACSTVSCLSKAYRERIDDLATTDQYLSKPAQYR